MAERMSIRGGERVRPILRLGSLSIATWTGLGFVTAIAFRLQSPGVGWGEALFRSFPQWYAWAILAPAVGWLAVRIPLGRGHRMVGILLHGLSAFSFSLIHLAMTVAGLQVLGAYGAEPLPWATRFLIALRGFLPFDLLIYSCLASIGLAVRSRLEYRGQILKSARSRSELSQARLQQLVSRLQPESILSILRGVSELALYDVAKTRRVIARLSTLLRSSLDVGQSPFVDLSREMAHLDLYLDIYRTLLDREFAIEMDVDLVAFDRRVPAFILQPLADIVLDEWLVDPVVASLRIGVRGSEAMKLRLCGHDMTPVRDADRAILVNRARAYLSDVYQQPVDLVVTREGTMIIVEVLLPSIDTPPFSGRSAA